MVFLLTVMFIASSAEGIHLCNIPAFLFSVIFLIPLGGIFLSRNKSIYTSFLLFTLSFFLFTCVNLPGVTDVSSGLPLKDMTSIEGKLMYDSGISENGNLILRVRADKGTDIYGNTTNCNGMICAIYKEKTLISAGIRVRLEGNFSDDLFICDDVTVLSRTRLNTFREDLISRIQNRIKTNDNPSSVLSLQLLLGRSDDDDFPLKEKARNCGCSHILALSGMHLGILAGFCRKLWPRKKYSWILSYPVVAAFLLAAGPRSSLLRAALMFFLPLKDIKERLLVSLLLQSIIFPYSMSDLGTVYGYCAVLGIIFISPHITGFLSSFTGDRIAGILSSSVCALLLCAPAQIISDGFWHPGALLLSAPAGLLASLSMIIGLMMIPFGAGRLLTTVNDSVYDIFEKMLDLGCRIPTLGWTGYMVFVSVVIALCLISLLPFRLTYRRKNNYTFRDDLGFRLQLGIGDYGSSGGKRSVHDKKVRTEFSHINDGS